MARMSAWPNQPWIVEINTWTWLRGLTLRYGRKMRLDCIPGFVWDELATTHADGVWLMGVWQRSAAGRQASLGASVVTSKAAMRGQCKTGHARKPSGTRLFYSAAC